MWVEENSSGQRRLQKLWHVVRANTDETGGFTFIVNSTTCLSDSLSEGFIERNGGQEVRLAGNTTFQMMIGECFGKSESE